MHKTSRSSKDHQSHSRQAASHAHRSSRSRSRSISQSKAGANSASAPKAHASTKQTFRTYNKMITNKQFDPLLPCRIFVGPLDPRPGIVDEDQLYDHFVRYGRITAIALHHGFAFIQFTKEPEARDAMAAENGAQFLGNVINVKPAVYGAGKKFGATGATISPEGPAPNTIRAPPLSAYPLEMSSPALPDRSASASMVASMTAPAPKPQAQNNSLYLFELIAASEDIRDYAEWMATKMEETLGPKGLHISLTVCPAPPIALDEFETRSRLPASRRPPAIALLFEEHMKHSSVTFRILHLKTPQEHRYVPLEQAVTLLSEDVEAFVRTARAGVEADPPDAVAGNQPPRRIAHALSLLLEGRLSLLTETDFDTLVSYLRARKETLFTGSTSGFSAAPPTQSALPTVPQQQFQQLASANYAQQFASNAFSSPFTQTPFVPAAVDASNVFMPASDALYAAPNLSTNFVDLMSGSPLLGVGPTALNTQLPPPSLLGANNKFRPLLPTPPKQSDLGFQPSMPAVSSSFAVQRAIDTLLSSGASILKMVSSQPKSDNI